MPVEDLFRDVEPLFRIVYFERPGWHSEGLFIGNVFWVQNLPVRAAGCVDNPFTIGSNPMLPTVEHSEPCP